MAPEKQWKQARTGTTCEGMRSMGTLGEQMGAGELQKVAGILEPNLPGQLLVQSLARHHFTSGIGKSRGEISYLGKVVNILSSAIKGF